MLFSFRKALPWYNPKIPPQPELTILTVFQGSQCFEVQPENFPDTHTHLWLAESHNTLGSTAEKEVSISSFNTSGIRASFQELPLYGYNHFRTGSLMVLNCSS